jgi:hypothetical protein
MDDRTAARVMAEIRQPTGDECTSHAGITVGERVGYACWWPQIGGYWGKALALPDEDDCIDVFVWHDGDFPFDGHCQHCRVDRSPVVLHVCDPGHFVRFGQFLNSLTEEETPDASSARDD